MIKKNIQNEISFVPEVIGYHEMWNSWIDVDLCDMAIKKNQQKITLFAISCASEFLHSAFSILYFFDYY